MKHLRTVVAGLTLLAGGTADAGTLVLTNAAIYTVDEARSWAEALAIDEDGILVAVGSKAEVLAAAGENAETVDLGGRMVLPGFQDIHLHAVEAGINAVLCPFEPFDTLAGYKATVRGCAENGGTGAWVLGAGVNMVNLLELHSNPVELLDEIAPDRPVMILDDIGHGAWANALA